MKKKKKIYIIQTNVFWEDKEKNRLHFGEKMKLINDKTDIIILPEMFNTGFSLNPKKNYELMTGDTVQWLKEMSKKKNCAIAGSIIIKESEKFFNRFIFVKPDGELHFYNKKHLFRMANEHEHYTTGDKIVIVDYKGWKIRLLVCYDLRFPVWSRNRKDYDLLIYVANWPTSRISQWNTLLTARAIENQAYVVGVNRIGSDGNNFNYSGSSQIINPKGVGLISDNTNKDIIETAELDYDRLIRYRENFSVFLDADNFEIKQ